MNTSSFALALIIALPAFSGAAAETLASDFAVPADEVARISEIELKEWFASSPTSYMRTRFKEYQGLKQAVAAVAGFDCQGNKVEFALGIFEDRQGYYRSYVRLKRNTDQELWTVDAIKETVDTPREIVQATRNLRTAGLCER